MSPLWPKLSVFKSLTRNLSGSLLSHMSPTPCRRSPYLRPGSGRGRRVGSGRRQIGGYSRDTLWLNLFPESVYGAFLKIQSLVIKPRSSLSQTCSVWRNRTLRSGKSFEILCLLTLNPMCLQLARNRSHYSSSDVTFGRTPIPGSDSRGFSFRIGSETGDSEGTGFQKSGLTSRSKIQ